MLFLPALLLCGRTPSAWPAADYSDFRQEDRDMKITGRVYHLSENKVSVEVWPQPRRMRPKVERIELVSPSGKRYKISPIENYPMSQVPKKREAFRQKAKRTETASLDAWLVETAWAEDCPPGCTDPSHHHGTGGESDDETDQKSAEAFAGFGLLVGMSATTEKEWVAGGYAEVEEEAGPWKMNVEVLDDKNQKHSFSVPFVLSDIPAGPQVKMAAPPTAGEREVKIVESVDTETGNVTTIRLNADGSRTVTVKGPDGKVISTETKPPAQGAKKTWLDPDTGLRISEWSNPDGSVTRRAEDTHGNWSEGTRFPGGKKIDTAPPNTVPPVTPATPQTPQTPATPGETPATPEEPGLPLPPQYRPRPDDPPGPPDDTPHTQERKTPPPETPPEEPPTQGEDKPPTIYGEELPLKIGVLLERDDDEWLPTNGGDTTVTATIYEMPPGGLLHHWRPSNQKRILTVRFVERSNQPGQCVNRDLDQANQESPDLYFRDWKNPDTECTQDGGSLGYHFGTSRTKREENSHRFTVSSEDYGAFSLMEASCPGCVQLYRHASGSVYESEFPDQYRVRLPKDDNDNKIADGWVWEKLRHPRDTDDDDDFPEGNGVAGDGYSAYEEFRGFMAKGSHVRTSLKTKTLFIRNRPNFDTSKFQASDLEFYDIDHAEWRTGDHVVNYNQEHAHVVDQHGLLLVESDLGAGGLGYTEHNGLMMVFTMGPPKHITKVRINSAAHADSKGVIDQDELRTTVAHELGHACCLYHHGEGGVDTKNVVTTQGSLMDYLSEIVPWTDERYGGDTLCGFQLPAVLTFGKKHAQSSGCLPCIMRYSMWGRVFVQENGAYECRGVNPTQDLFCDSKTGTGWNAGNHVAGDATRGDCKHMFQVNDK
ncbi:MAG TPA: hypothetical protein VL404_08265 [Candidatus Eisenbacteria bacterium]|nr:hypothetical protein [Candidatus Eisenbacteria bacterium]